MRLKMSSAYVPYNGTAGWSGTDTSKQRAIDNVESGRELNNQEFALHLLKRANVGGLTWKELATFTGWHHGTASGVLSVLHQSGAIVRLHSSRNRCKIYVHQNYKDQVKHEVYRKKEKLCPHCGHDINA
jgi:DNA-binding MarR family transcriptional regulator